MTQETNQNHIPEDKDTQESAAIISETVENPEETARVNTAQDQNNSTNDLMKDAMQALNMQAQRQAVDEADAVFTNNMVLLLEVQESGKLISNTVGRELIVGRADNITDYIPEIDMTEHGAYRLGLSRRHAVIQRDGNSLVVKDLNSRNGTFVNGAIVPGGNTHPIRNGDELRFGNLVTHVIFEQQAE
jgi:hypothetical protein